MRSGRSAEKKETKRNKSNATGLPEVKTAMAFNVFLVPIFNFHALKAAKKNY